ncbi:hypothetical protein AB6A40_001620 [Gnathostoma spinigerum]|uniref:MICOS complex subunit n=1 Tax=Gnathostoma spinigerum TaxID=75299 RepID=A0ABD6E6X5_9BILA
MEQVGNASDERSPVKSVRDKVASFTQKWWSLMTTEKKPPPDPKKLVTVKDLPMYREQHPVTYRFIEDDPLPLQHSMSVIRKFMTSRYHDFAERYSVIDKAGRKTACALGNSAKYLQDEWTILPKAIAISMGGLAGFLLGLRRSGARRIIYSATGLLGMAAFCYPEETAMIVRTGIAHSQMTWERFASSPEPPVPKKADLAPPTE